MGASRFFLCGEESGKGRPDNKTLPLEKIEALFRRQVPVKALLIRSRRHTTDGGVTKNVLKINEAKSVCHTEKILL